MVFGTYDPTTIRPPFLSLCTPMSLGEIGTFGFIPILADTKLAAVRHKKCLPFISACQLHHILVKELLFFCFSNLWSTGGGRIMELVDTCLDHSCSKHSNIPFTSRIDNTYRPLFTIRTPESVRKFHISERTIWSKVQPPDDRIHPFIKISVCYYDHKHSSNSLPVG